ncbi:hypothetical protein WJX72_007318 [[Myrmecia] bisecta]|uniref:TauD/TfdA-like domain-containing protein n=1 Tax=[Myrmecia] bisecta TaxID=41462 RepID=A0AAW1QSD3_9CHLO
MRDPDGRHPIDIGSTLQPDAQACCGFQARLRQSDPTVPALKAQCIYTPSQAAAIATRGSALGLTFTPAHANFGAVVGGMDLAQPLSEEVKKLLVDAMLVYDLLAFRGQHLEPAQEMALLTAFPHDEEALARGKLVNYLKPRIPAHPLLALRAHNVNEDEHHGITGVSKLNFGDVNLPGLYWHVDFADKPCVTNITSIYTLEAPDNADTIFASSTAGYAMLSPAEQHFAEQLDMMYDRGSTQYNPMMDGAGIERLDDMEEGIRRAAEDPSNPFHGMRDADQLNPFVIYDQQTGRRSLITACHFFHKFKGLGRQESLRFHTSVMRRVCAPENVLRWKWRAGDWVLWSNRRMVHSAAPVRDYRDKTRLIHLAFLDSKDAVQAARDAQ